MVSDSELIERLREILSASDLNTTTTAIVRRRLEEDFGIDLSDRKAFIREQVDVYMQSQFKNAGENENEINDEGAVEEQVEEEEEEEQEEEEEEEVEEEEEEDSTAATYGKSSTKKRPRKEEEVKKRGGGFTKLCTLSPELQKFTGVPELARTEVVKQLWNYIRENNMQDPSNKRSIICDDTFRNLFGVDSIDMFQMNKALAKHIWPLGSDCAPQSSAPKEKEKEKEKQRKRNRDEDQDEPRKKEKQKRGGNSGFLTPLKLSDALVKFLGTEENALPRSDVVKRIWDYIKLNNLQDPSDRRQILCDEKLKELFNVDTFRGFTVAKLLTSHFIKTEQ